MRDHGEAAQAEQVGAAVGVRVEPLRAGGAPPGGSAGRRACPRGVAVISSRSASSSVLIVPSSSFSATLPVKPSQTTTSAAPRSRSRLSALPREVEVVGSRPAARAPRASAGCPSRPPRRSRAAAPRAARRRGSPRRRRAPMCANWSRCSGRASAFAPASSSTDGPVARRDRRPRSPAAATPGRRRSSSRPAASIAPVFPAETTASACPRRPRGTARDERAVRLRRARPRPASRPSRSRSVVSTSSSPLRVEPGRAEEDGLDRRPAAASTAPATTSSGPRSPPSASTATRDHPATAPESERLDLAAAGTSCRSGRSGAAASAGRTAGRVHARRRDPVLRAALVAAGLRRFPLRDGHGRGVLAGLLASPSKPTYLRRPHQPCNRLLLRWSSRHSAQRGRFAESVERSRGACGRA